MEDSALMRCTSRSWLCDARAIARKSSTDASETSRKLVAELSRNDMNRDAIRRYLSKVPGALLLITASKCSDACAVVDTETKSVEAEASLDQLQPDGAAGLHARC